MERSPAEMIAGRMAMTLTVLALAAPPMSRRLRQPKRLVAVLALKNGATAYPVLGLLRSRPLGDRPQQQPPPCPARATPGDADGAALGLAFYPEFISST